MHIFPGFGLQTLGGSVIILTSPLEQIDFMSQCKCAISAVRITTSPESTTSMTKQSTDVLDGVEATGTEIVPLFLRLINRMTVLFSVP